MHPVSCVRFEICVIWVKWSHVLVEQWQSKLGCRTDPAIRLNLLHWLERSDMSDAFDPHLLWSRHFLNDASFSQCLVKWSEVELTGGIHSRTVYSLSLSASLSFHFQTSLTSFSIKIQYKYILKSICISQRHWHFVSLTFHQEHKWMPERCSPISALFYSPFCHRASMEHENKLSNMTLLINQAPFQAPIQCLGPPLCIHIWIWMCMRLGSHKHPQDIAITPFYFCPLYFL